MPVQPNQAPETCFGCVYYPPNLPPSAYDEDDYRMLQEKSCSFDFNPDDQHCQETRKTSCSLVDLQHLQKTTATRGTS